MISYIIDCQPYFAPQGGIVSEAIRICESRRYGNSRRSHVEQAQGPRLVTMLNDSKHRGTAGRNRPPLYMYAHPQPQTHEVVSNGRGIVGVAGRTAHGRRLVLMDSRLSRLLALARRSKDRKQLVRPQVYAQQQQAQRHRWKKPSTSVHVCTSSAADA